MSFMHPINGILGTSSTAITTGPNVIVLPSGHHAYVTDEMTTRAGTQAVSKLSKSHPEISPRLYFKFVKSKLKQSEQETLKKRLGNLTALYKDAKLIGQDGLADELKTKIAITIREQEVSVCGYGKYVFKKDIDKFKNIVTDRTIGFCKLDEFPRPIKSDVRVKIKEAQERDVFDEYWVLYFNPDKTEAKKSNEKKIMEKDPILFGKFTYDPERYFHIVSWEDDWCDLTIDKFCETMNTDKTLKKEYQLEEICELAPCEIKRIKDEVLDSYERLRGTNRGNFLANAEEERKAKQKKIYAAGAVRFYREVDPINYKTKWYKFWEKHEVYPITLEVFLASLKARAKENCVDIALARGEETGIAKSVDGVYHLSEKDFNETIRQLDEMGVCKV